MNKEILLEEINAKELAEKIKKGAQEATNEEELRIFFAEILNPILRSWNIKFSYEKRAPRYVVSGVRKDALYGTVILEFKAPGKLGIPREFEKISTLKPIKNAEERSNHFGVSKGKSKIK